MKSKSTVTGLVVAVAIGGAALVLWFFTPLCACTPAPDRVATPSSVAAGLASIDSAQDTYYSMHGRYSDSLASVLPALPAAWQADVPIATEGGFDVELRLAAEGITCTHIVRRVTDDTLPRRRTSCYRIPTSAAPN